MNSEEVKQNQLFDFAQSQSKMFGDFQKQFLEKQSFNNTSRQNEIFLSTFRKSDKFPNENSLNRENEIKKELFQKENLPLKPLNKNEDTNHLFIEQIPKETKNPNENINKNMNNNGSGGDIIRLENEKNTINNEWATRANILIKVRIFINKLKNASSLRNLVLTENKSYIRLLSDKIFYDENSIENNSLCKKFNSSKIFKMIRDIRCSRLRMKFINKLKTYLKSCSLLFYPYSNIKILWNIIQLLLIIFWIFLIPLTIAFEEVNLFEHANSLPSLILFIIDIMMTINTSFFRNGVLEEKRKKIFLNYLKNEFIIDLFGIFPLFLNQISINLTIFKCLFFFKIFKIQNILDRILEKLLIKEKLHQIIRLIKVLFISLCVAHIFACLWYLSTKISDSTDNWLSRIEIDSKSWSTQYLYSLYWAFVTMMTVGYGDITPRNEIEIIICLIALVLGCVVYAYNINSVGMILQDINKEESDFQHKINIINNFMYKKKISADLQRRVREYLRFIWIEENLRHSDEEHEIIQLLSNALREELLLQSYDSILKKSSMFYANFTEKTLRKTVSIIKDIKLFPDEIIFTENEEDNNSIYFIKKGKIELFTGSGHIIKELGPHAHFGEVSFFTGNKRVLSARTKSFTTLYAINQKDFIEILKNQPEDYEKYCMIKDQINLYGDYSSLRSYCFSCKGKHHLVKECPMNHYIPDKERIIKKLNFYVDNERNKDFLRKTFKCNSLLNLKKIVLARNKFNLRPDIGEKILTDNQILLSPKINDEESNDQILNKNDSSGDSEIKDMECSLQNIASTSENELNRKKKDLIFLEKEEIKEEKDNSLNFLNNNEEIEKNDFDINNLPHSLNTFVVEGKNKTENWEFTSNSKIKTVHKINGNDSPQKITEIKSKKLISIKNNERKGNSQMDALKKYKIYFPKGNADNVAYMIKELQETCNIKEKVEKKERLDTQISKYTFFIGKMKSIIQPNKLKKRKKEELTPECKKKKSVLTFKQKANIFKNRISLLAKKISKNKNIEEKLNYHK